MTYARAQDIDNNDKKDVTDMVLGIGTEKTLKWKIVNFILNRYHNNLKVKR